jgi:hypothetical protein
LPTPRKTTISGVLARAVLVAAAAAVASGMAGAGESRALAYPQFQLSSGSVRCNQCHYAPAGGGLINSWGRDEAGDALSSWDSNGAFAHGAVNLPRWLALGGDFRGAFVNNDVQDPSGPVTAVFPMQADVNVRLATHGVSLNGTIGLRGQVRDPGVIVPIQNYQPVSTSELISREHYAMWQPEALGPYLRVGRFYAPYGLRLAEHILYINRDLGFDDLQETYNVSGGLLFDAWELHVTAFAPDFVRHMGSDEKGFAGYYERRLLDNKMALAAQARIAAAPGVTRFMFGGLAKLYVEGARTLLMAEVNSVQLAFDDQMIDPRQQVVGAAGVTLFPVRGLMATFLGERNQVDLQVANDAWTAATGLLNWFPIAHLELQVMGRLQWPGNATPAKTLFAQLHYYL